MGVIYHHLRKHPESVDFGPKPPKKPRGWFFWCEKFHIFWVPGTRGLFLLGDLLASPDLCARASWIEKEMTGDEL